MRSHSRPTDRAIDYSVINSMRPVCVSTAVDRLDRLPQFLKVLRSRFDVRPLSVDSHPGCTGVIEVAKGLRVHLFVCSLKT